MLQQHGLLHGECFLSLRVVWSSKQLGELLPEDGLLLLELGPVVMQAVWVLWKGEVWNRGQLGALEAGRAGHPTWGLRGWIVHGLPREHIHRRPSPSLWQIVPWARLISGIHLSVHLCSGVELLKVEGGGASRGFQLQRVHWGGPGFPGVVGRAGWRLPAVGGERIVHESLFWRNGVGVPLGGGVCCFPIYHIGRWDEPGRRTVESVLSSVVQTHGVRWMEDGDLCGSPAHRVLLGRGVVLVDAARVPDLDPSWITVGKQRRRRVFPHPGP